MTFTEDHRRELLGKIEHLVQTKFYDPTFKGRDWKSIVESHRSEVLSAADLNEFERAVNKMLSELGSSGLGLISAQTQIAPKNSISATFRAIETEYGNRWVFQDVHVGGPAAAAGVRPGDVLISIGNREIAPPEKPAFAMGRIHEVLVERFAGPAKIAIAAPDAKHKENPCAVPDAVKAEIRDKVAVVKVPLFPGRSALTSPTSCHRSSKNG